MRNLKLIFDSIVRRDERCSIRSAPSVRWTSNNRALCLFYCRAGDSLRESDSFAATIPPALDCPADGRGPECEAAANRITTDRTQIRTETVKCDALCPSFSATIASDIFGIVNAGYVMHSRCSGRTKRKGRRRAIIIGAATNICNQTLVRSRFPMITLPALRCISILYSFYRRINASGKEPRLSCGSAQCIVAILSPPFIALLARSVSHSPVVLVQSRNC